MYILPEPKSIIMRDNEFILNYNTKIILSDQLGSKEYHYAKILKKQVEDTLSFTLNFTKSNEIENNSIVFQIVDNIKSEEYHLTISEDRINIIAGNTNALLYGVQTLRQMISQRGSVLPCLEIKDYPDIVNRGFYHDVTRGRIPKLESLKALADKISYYKMNQMQLYIEHSFLFRNLSEVWRDDTPITAEEIIELDEYCRSLNIELVPSVASFGHLYKLLRTKTYEELCELDNPRDEEFSFVNRMLHHTLDVTNEKSIIVVKELLSEYLPLFSSKQFNICSDETFDLGKGKSKALADECGVDRIYVDFLKKICQFITEHGRRTMFWGDVIISKPETIKELPENVICLNWDYNDVVPEVNAKKLYELGVKQYLCPGVQGWNRLINRLDYAYLNITNMCRHAHKFHAEGVLNTDWGDYGHINLPEFSTSGMIYGASFSWNEEQLPFDEINRRISVIEYQDRSENFVKLIHELSSQDKFKWGILVEFKEMSQKLIPDTRMNWLNEINWDSILKANEKLDQAVKRMHETMSEMDSSKRNVVKAYLIMARGIQLFNILGATVAQDMQEKRYAAAASNPKKLAVDIEYWLREYKELWREVSKEGELYQLQDVLIWYADWLREVEINNECI